MASKKELLETLQGELARNRSLPLFGQANLVFGEGDPDARIMFIGEAPGFHENELRRPFVGQSGKLLDKLFASVKVPRISVYITNIVKRRPPQNRDPLPEEIEAYKPFLARQIEIIDPKIVATLGRFSMNYFLPEARISNDHGRATKLGKFTIFPLYHPAAALRAGAVMRQLETDFQKLAALSRSFDAAPVPPEPSNPTIPPPEPQASLF